jgi:1-deoxy-D-xylulose-5-phosphate synthase
VITIEDNTVMGGFGSAVAEYYAARQLPHVAVHMHGVPDHFIDHGSPAELAAETGLDSAGIAHFVRAALDRSVSSTAG